MDGRACGVIHRNPHGEYEEEDDVVTTIVVLFCGCVTKTLMSGVLVVGGAVVVLVVGGAVVVVVLREVWMVHMNVKKNRVFAFLRSFISLQRFRSCIYTYRGCSIRFTTIKLYYSHRNSRRRTHPLMCVLTFPLNADSSAPPRDAATRARPGGAGDPALRGACSDREDR